MRGGEIVVGGDAGAQAGAGLRRGLIAVAGRAGEAAGLRMLAGTIVALGGLGPRRAAGMRRGSIVTMAPATPPATFVFSCIYRPPFLRLYLRRLRRSDWTSTRSTAATRAGAATRSSCGAARS